MKKQAIYYEETPDRNKMRKIFNKKDLDMEAKVPTKKPTTKVEKKKTTLSVYTYMNFKRFGLSVAIDSGIKINILWFETAIKFEKLSKQ